MPPAQAEAVQLLQELSMASEEALALTRELPDLVPALRAIASPGTGPLGRVRERIVRSQVGAGVLSGLGVGEWAERGRRAGTAAPSAAVSAASKVRVVIRKLSPGLLLEMRWKVARLSREPVSFGPRMRSSWRGWQRWCLDQGMATRAGERWEGKEWRLSVAGVTPPLECQRFVRFVVRHA